ncbi:hypothetical protein VTL71DRAFT_12040 [Oculimacula yallundae]|uniref:Heterokaryon incompatibility domain-containing protein n=1 Tax=Oculimacula yallundae TaxID=86028 RepID=A0ABR4CSE5_9HELO
MKSIARAQDASYTLGLGPEVGDLYVFKPLPTPTSIRVIEWPRELVTTSDLRCSFRVIDLEDPHRPEFTTLSYTWGGWNGVQADDVEALDDLFVNTIICEGGLLRVTENAHRALCELRWRGRACLFWVDAVCINQRDNDERAQQVAMMGRIYASAVRTMVWLGEDDKDAEYLHDVIGKRQQGLENAYVPADDTMFIPLDEPLDIVRMLDAEHNREIINPFHLLTFFARPWFQRLWVIQEVVLAKNIHVICGKYNFSWNFLVSVILLYFEQAFREAGVDDETLQSSLRGRHTVISVAMISQPIYFQKMLTNIDMRSATRRLSATLPALIETLQYNLASDSRDRIFAPLALATHLCEPGLPVQLQPRYDEPIEMIFLSASRYILEQSCSLNLLGLCKGSGSSLPLNMPTWVPDFRIMSRQRSISSRLIGHARSHNRTLDDQLTIEEEFGSLALKVSGVKFDVLDNVSAPLIETISGGCINLLLEFASGTPNSTTGSDEGPVDRWELLKFLDLIAISPSPGSSSESYWLWLAFKLALSISKDKLSLQVVNQFCARASRFSIDDFVDDRLPKGPSLRELSRLTSEVITLLQPQKKFEDSLIKWWPRIMAFQTSIIPVITGRSFFRLANGIIGIGPSSARSGDQIWGLSGATAHIMLRPARCGGQFEVIGEVHIPGHLQLQSYEKRIFSKISLV